MRCQLNALTLFATLSTFARAYVHDIAVGGLNADGTPHLAFTPPYISAAVGDTVRFTFNVKNHSVTQSSFAEPCSKLANAYGTPIGFDSGFRPVAAGTANADLPTFEITVNDTAPIWGYCMQVNPPNPTHCQSGMVFGINPPAMGNTFEKFLAMAKASGSTDSSTTTTATEAQFTSTVVVFEEGETTTVTSSEFQFTSTVVVFEEGETTTITPYATSAAGKSTFNLAASNTGSDSDAEKLLNTYAPVIVGLLAATLALLLAVLGVGAALSRRVMARPSRSMALRRNSRYSQVSLNVPELGEYTGLSKENNNGSNEIRYAGSGEYTDRV